MAVSFANLPKFLVKNLLPALRAMPPRAALKFVSNLGRIEYTLNGPRRRKYSKAVLRAAGHLGEPWDAFRTGRELAANQFRWRARDLLLDRLSDDQAAAFFEVRGAENLDRAVAEGKGVVLLFNHFGPFLMPAHWIVRRGYPLRWFTERPRQISKLVSRDFGDDGPLGQRKLFISRRLSPKEGSAAIRRAVKVLQAGMIVQLAGDVRWSGPRTAPGRLLGRHYGFTTTWITLAAMTGSPVVPAFSVMRPDGSCGVEFLDAFTVDPGVTRDDLAVARLVQRNLDAIEEHIRAHPDNSLDYFFWNEGDPTGAEQDAA